MAGDFDKKIDVICGHFRMELNCGVTGNGIGQLQPNIRNSCCYDKDTSTPYAGGIYTLQSCCEALEEGGYDRRLSGWDSGSYQAYVMGVAVVAILLCLFISGARSVRKRRMMIVRERQRRALEASGQAPSTAVTADPPTYGELEAHGLTKDFKCELLPPAYPVTLTLPSRPSDIAIMAPETPELDQNSTAPTDSTESMEPPPYSAR